MVQLTKRQMQRAADMNAQGRRKLLSLHYSVWQP
jgi:hypothetical protein